MRIKSREELGRGIIDEIDKARFWSKVKLPRVTNSPERACWVWTGRSHKGYGQFHINRRTEYAPRIAWTIFFGNPGKKWVLHKCDNPACVNPFHLFVGDAKVNAQDMAAKGRQWLQKASAKVRHASAMRMVVARMSR